MTKPRTNSSRELFGILGTHPERSALQRTWNAYFTTQGIDAFLDYYPTTIAKIPERLSEMYHFDRRAYIVGSALFEAISSYVDVCHSSATEQGTITILYNRNGVVEGWYIPTLADPAFVLSLLAAGEEL